VVAVGVDQSGAVLRGPRETLGFTCAGVAFDGVRPRFSRRALWERASVAVLADPRVRRELANRAELVELGERLEPEYGEVLSLILGSDDGACLRGLQYSAPV